MPPPPFRRLDLKSRRPTPNPAKWPLVTDFPGPGEGRTARHCYHLDSGAFQRSPHLQRSPRGRRAARNGLLVLVVVESASEHLESFVQRRSDIIHNNRNKVLRMARKHEHFGLSYLEELIIVKERENICKESRREFLKFKQELVSDCRNVNKALLEVTASGQSPQIQSKTRSPSLRSGNKHLSPEWDTSTVQKKVRIPSDIIEETIQTEDTGNQPKKSPKKQNSLDDKKKTFHSGKAILEHTTGSPGDEAEKMPVLIASLAGTTKQLTILKKPESLKPKSPKFPCAKLLFKTPLSMTKDSITTIKQLEQKILSQHVIPPIARASAADIDDTCSVISGSTEKSMNISEEVSEPNILSGIERSYSKKSSGSSSRKSVSECLEETLSESRVGPSKSLLKSFSFCKSQANLSISKFPSGIVSRSIDEIIESLKSTVPTPSDLRIKELLESLGQDYLIKIQKPSHIRKERGIEFVSPSVYQGVQLTPEDAVQLGQSKDVSLRKGSIFRKVQQEGEDYAVEDILRTRRRTSIFLRKYEGQVVPSEAAGVREYLAVEQNVPESKSISLQTQEEAHEVKKDTSRTEVPEVATDTSTEESDYVFKTFSQERRSIQESEDYSSTEAEQLQKSVAEEPNHLVHVTTEEKLEDFLSSDMDLMIQGRAFPKARPVEIQKSIEDPHYQQPVSLLSTWTTKIKDVDYPLIHLLCTTCPGFVLPTDLQLVSRVHHTIDKHGQNISLPPINFDCHNSEELFPATAALEEHIYRERIYNEGLPISVVCQCNQEDGIKVLPPRSPRSMPEWQRIAEFYVEKPQLKLLGKKVKLQPGSLKMFWTPAPHKFSAPLSVMKEILFSKYESNLVNGVIYEDFSIDLREKETGDYEDDFDNLFSNINANGRRGSFPELLLCETDTEDEDITYQHLMKRANSAPEMSTHRDKTAVKISADFKTTMEEIEIMGKHVPLVKMNDTVPEAEGSSLTPNLPKHFSPPKPFPDPEKVSEIILENVMKVPRGNLFEPQPAESVRVLDETALADECRKAGINSVSLGKLNIHHKFSIKVSRAVQHYRSPSLPCVLDFETFSKKRGKALEDPDYVWATLLWNQWFEELFVPIKKSDEDKQMSHRKLSEEKMEDAAKENELPNYVNPFLFDGKKEQLAQCEHEIERTTQEINKGCATAFNYCRRGAIYRKIGKMQAAMDDLEKAISMEPMLTNAYWHRHLIFLYQNKILPALEDLNFVIKCNKNYTDAYLSTAQIYKKQGNNHLAIINYTLALRCRPTDDEIYYKRGEVYEEEGDLIMAMEDYTKCLYYNPERTDARMKHGIYYFNKSSWAIAMNDFTSVINKDPKHAEARTYRGRTYIKQKQYKNAVEDLSAGIHLNPRNWVAFYHRGCILRKIDQKQSLQDLSVSVLLNHKYDNLGAYLHRGILYTELKQWILAIYDFQSALALDRTLKTAYVNIGLIMMLHMDQYFDAIRQFTEAIQVDPLDIRPYLCRAQAYQRVHDLRSSVKDINRAIHLYPNIPHLCLTRGQYLLQMKKFQLASFCIYQVAEMDKGSLGCSLVQEALVQSFCQNYNKAIECAIAATKNQPEPAMFSLLGKIQMKARKFKDALSSFNEGLVLLTGSDKLLPSTSEAAELYFLKGQCYMEQVFLLEACDAFTSAVRLYPRYADAFYQRGLCRMQLQQAKCILDFNKTLAVLPTHFQAYLSRAAYYGCKGRYSKAIMNCTEALKIEPQSVRGYLYRGVLKFYNRTYKHAVEDLTKAIDLDNVCILAYYNRAIAFQQLKDYENSLRDYGIVLLLETNKDIVLKVLINRALVYIEMKHYDFALEDFADVAMTEQKNKELFISIGLCYHRLKKYEEAVESFSKVLQLDPFFLDAYIGRGNAYLEYGHTEGARQALKDFLKAVHINPVCIKARLCLGYNLQALGKFQKAWTQFTAAICCDPSCHIAYDGRAIVCLQMGDTFAAFQDTNAALKITINAELLTNRGVINQFMGYLNCAMRDYQQAITVDPNYALAYFNAANIYFLNKQFSQANDYYTKALMLDSENESAFLNRAITNTLLRNFEEAKADFEKAICLSPFSAAIYFNKANLYSMLQQYEQAEEDISKALSIQPYDALMYKLRADIRGKMGLIKEAIADYKKAISIQELISSS
ncbi:tetratricopeptide repeat protein 6 [Python bivittatus]|uniref:Tetratricopeptide repeat protein 6 n=1 Tax=Python bivittatus TaxID=176946 RepID=A0A9F5MS56_PYTBI|nr:tetratricopeptide repeat protein 6 [Python bivittatus]